jgi:hypothetical protein
MVLFIWDWLGWLYWGEIFMIPFVDLSNIDFFCYKNPMLYRIQ